MMMDPNTLMIIQRERHNELVREAALQRLLQKVEKNGATADHATVGRATTNGVTTWLQLLATGLPTRLWAALSR